LVGVRNAVTYYSRDELAGQLEWLLPDVWIKASLMHFLKYRRDEAEAAARTFACALPLLPPSTIPESVTACKTAPDTLASKANTRSKTSNAPSKILTSSPLSIARPFCRPTPLCSG
jgi:hypothetical protein